MVKNVKRISNQIKRQPRVSNKINKRKENPKKLIQNERVNLIVNEMQSVHLLINNIRRQILSLRSNYNEEKQMWIFNSIDKVEKYITDISRILKNNEIRTLIIKQQNLIYIRYKRALETYKKGLEELNNVMNNIIRKRFKNGEINQKQQKQFSHETFRVDKLRISINQMIEQLDRYSSYIRQEMPDRFSFLHKSDLIYSDNAHESLLISRSHKIIELANKLFKNIYLEGGGFKNIFKDVLTINNFEKLKVILERMFVADYYLSKTSFYYYFDQHKNNYYNQIYNDEMINRLLLMLSSIPISNSGDSFYVLQVCFKLRCTDNLNIDPLPRTRNWFIHPQAAAQIIASLFKYLNSSVRIEENAEISESDPASILAYWSHLIYVKFMPISEMLENELKHEFDTNCRDKIEREFKINPPELLTMDLYNKQIINNQTYYITREQIRNLEPNEYNFNLIKYLIEVFRSELVHNYDRILNKCDLTKIDQNIINKYRHNHQGGFFPYYNLTDLNLLRYQIANNSNNFETNREIFDESCLTFALKKSGQFTESQIQEISSICYGRVIAVSKLARSCYSYDSENKISQINFRIILRKYYPSNESGHRTKKYLIPTELFKSDIDTTNIKTIELGLICDHFFIIDRKTKVTAFYLTHYKQIKEIIKNQNLEIPLDKQYTIKRINLSKSRNIEDNQKHYSFEYNNQETKFLDSYEIITKLIEQKLVEPVMMSDVISLELSLYNNIIKEKNKDYLGSLNYTPKLALKTFEEYNKNVTPTAVSLTAIKSNDQNLKVNYDEKIQKFKKFKKDLNKDLIEENKKLLQDLNRIVIFYADFESFTVDNNRKHLLKHQPFLCCLGNSLNKEIETFKGPNCGELMLDRIINLIEKDKLFKNKSPLIYFHNLGYDINFLAKYGIVSSMKRGRKNLMSEINYKGHILTFKDSLSLLPMKLENFPAIFGFEEVKELFPYDFYTAERFYNPKTLGIYPVLDVIKFMHWENDSKKFNTFIDNVIKIKGLESIDKTNLILLNQLTFNMYDYAKFYCERDVYVLKKGLNKFIKSIKQEFDIDAVKYLSISSIADAIFNKNVYSKIPKLYKVGGIVREFLGRAVHGGRVMPGCNKKWAYKLSEQDMLDVNKGLCDFDAVSLYPSAIARLWLVEGKPKVLSDEELHNKTFFNNKYYTAYVVEIVIDKINKPRDFPLVIGYNSQTGSVLNTNQAPVVMTVCDIELEDLVNFQQIEYTAIRGYYWTGKKHYEGIRNCITNIFEKRLIYKEQHNMLQSVYKLVMNSAYGKSIMKPHSDEILYLNKINDVQQIKQLFRLHASEIKFVDGIEDSNILAVKKIKPINNHFNFSLFGIHILAMSKRIMNEVMCLADDLGMRIYYQDTDSMHIEKSDVIKLAQVFKTKYNRELIGKNLGQFHSDFDPITPDSKDVRSVEAYFIGKKCYVDKLMDEKNNIGYHMRMKGVPQESIIYLAEKEYNGDVLKLYKDLALGKNLTFDLLAGGKKVMFDYTRSMTVQSKDSFDRNECFNTTLKPDNYNEEEKCFVYIDSNNNIFKDYYQ